MNKKGTIVHYYDTIVNANIFPSKGNLRFHLDTVFQGIDFTNRRVLDIGGGNGIYSYYASCKGAKEVICLEPASEGSTANSEEVFFKLGKQLNCNNITLNPVTFQDFNPGNVGFDIILFNNSINHLDETACINLQRDESCKSIYKEIFFNISLLSNKGAKIIICDCTRYNIFAILRIKNPFAPTIEWHKHQSPKVWSELLRDVGFINPRIRWSSFNKLRYFGKVISANKLMAFFLNSHFCLTMEKS